VFIANAVATIWDRLQGTCALQAGTAHGGIVPLNPFCLLHLFWFMHRARAHYKLALHNVMEPILAFFARPAPAYALKICREAQQQLKDADAAEKQLPECFQALNENAYLRSQVEMLLPGLEKMAHDPTVIAVADAQRQRELQQQQQRDLRQEAEEKRLGGVQHCAGCGAKESAEKRLKKCTACALVRYCSRDCQKADWRFHKALCKAKTAGATGNS
jgi:hypothetical protein